MVDATTDMMDTSTDAQTHSTPTLDFAPLLVSPVWAYTGAFPACDVLDGAEGVWWVLLVLSFFRECRQLSQQQQQHQPPLYLADFLYGSAGEALATKFCASLAEHSLRAVRLNELVEHATARNALPPRTAESHALCLQQFRDTLREPPMRLVNDVEAWFVVQHLFQNTTAKDIELPVAVDKTKNPDVSSPVVDVNSLVVRSLLKPAPGLNLDTIWPLQSFLDLCHDNQLELNLKTSLVRLETVQEKRLTGDIVCAFILQSERANKDHLTYVTHTVLKPSTAAAPADPVTTTSASVTDAFADAVPETSYVDNVEMTMDSGSQSIELTQPLPLSQFDPEENKDEQDDLFSPPPPPPPSEDVVHIPELKPSVDFPEDAPFLHDQELHSGILRDTRVVSVIRQGLDWLLLFKHKSNWTVFDFNQAAKQSSQESPTVSLEKVTSVSMAIQSQQEQAMAPTEEEFEEPTPYVPTQPLHWVQSVETTELIAFLDAWFDKPRKIIGGDADPYFKSFRPVVEVLMPA